MGWQETAGLKHEGVWWGLRPIQEVFSQVVAKKQEQTLMTAIRALSGILNT